MFVTEEKMVRVCLDDLYSKYSKNNVITEPTGLFGIPDIMVKDKQIISIEAKLKNWKRALEQAYKYRLFSEKSYVYMDEDYINAPLKNIENFKKFNIGLVGVSEKKMTTYFEPKQEEPFSNEFHEEAIKKFENT